MATLNGTDIAVRLFHTKCCTVDKAICIIDKIKRGHVDNTVDQEKFQLIVNLLKVQKEYCPTGPNYISEDESQHIWQVLSELCELCFAPIGFNY